MKKFPAKAGKPVRAIAFLLILGILLWNISYIVRPYSGSASRKNVCGFYAEKADTLDAVFVGSSSVFAFWQPMEFWHSYGVATYDFATGTMPPQCIKYCIKEIEKTQSPQLIVIDAKTFVTAETGYYTDETIANMDHEVPLRYVADNFKYSLNRLELINNCVPDTYDKLSFYIDLFKYHTEWTSLFDRQSLAYAGNESRDFNRGYNTETRWKALEVTDYSNVKKKKALSERVEAVLTDLLEYCQGEDFQVLFLAPMYRQSKSDKQTFNYIADIVEEYGYTLLNVNDYQEETGMDFSTDYYDKDHVNIFGAQKYTEFVGNYLMENYSLADHRGDSAYAAWEEDYSTWTQRVDETQAGVLELIEAAAAE